MKRLFSEVCICGSNPTFASQFYVSFLNNFLSNFYRENFHFFFSETVQDPVSFRYYLKFTQ